MARHAAKIETKTMDAIPPVQNSRQKTPGSSQTHGWAASSSRTALQGSLGCALRTNSLRSSKLSPSGFDNRGVDDCPRVGRRALEGGRTGDQAGAGRSADA